MKQIVYILVCLSCICVCLSQKIKLNDKEMSEERRNGSTKLDPYQIKLKQLCINGEFSECFKLQAVNSLAEFFTQNEYLITPYIKIVRLPETQQKSLINEPIEYIAETRDSDSEWDQLQKFLLRKAERFIKATAFEVRIPEEFKQDEMLSPRFIDEIYEEIDVLEDTKAPLFNKHRLKKMFVPMLLILKLFKLKLLLFLPLVIGLTGLKKIVGFIAFILPGIIGYFKLCKPNFGLFKNPIHEYTPQYNSNGLGFEGVSTAIQNNYKESQPISGFSGIYHEKKS
uniref:CSON013602 protein n=1 Tax=Culicoides sonorensis TaxID=179676 RepID=A0A336KQ65_CULSO